MDHGISWNCVPLGGFVRLVVRLDGFGVGRLGVEPIEKVVVVGNVKKLLFEPTTRILSDLDSRRGWGGSGSSHILQVFI